MTQKLPAWLSSTLASDAAEGRNVLPLDIKPLSADSRVAAPAFVVRAGQDDNQAVVQAVATPPPEGCVLVVSGMNTSRTATIGGLVALELKNRGVVGLVTDGPVRDAREIRDLGLAVWCRGTTPTASNKRGPGSVGGTIEIGGVLVSDGDLVIADEDGVVIWPRAQIDSLLRRAEARFESDNQRLERLKGGGGAPA